jgi:hypothetical protein
METTFSVSGDPAGEVPAAEPRPIYLRAYGEPALDLTPKRGSFSQRPSHYVLVFDCETTDDEVQRLRFGSYQVRAGGILKEKGLFFDPDAVDENELEALHFERPPGHQLRDARSFIEEIFYDVGYKNDATIVGFNLPFDISRLAISQGSAKAVRRGKRVDRSMVGGFTFKLSNHPGRPNVRVKHLSRKAAFINFAAPDENPTGEPVNRGFFLDLKTLSGALTSKSFKLDTLAVHLGMPKKKPFTDFGRKIDHEFMEYAAQDSETTWRCYQALIERYDAHDLWRMEATQIYSEASLGKAYLSAMGIKPWLAVEKTYSAVTIGRIMSAYYGGRAEVHRRREIVLTRYCDFASMYPTTCSLMGLWRFVIAEGVEECDATDDVKTLLRDLRIDQLKDQNFWLNLRVLVEVKPDADIFPVRARYGEGPSQTIGVNHLTADRTLWFTLADCIASTLLSGKAPEVVSAIRFEPKAVQDGLKCVAVAGSGHVVDPRADDFYRRVINIRRAVKADLADAELRQAPKLERDQLDAKQLALKILANATSYGVFIEINPEPADEDGEEVRVYGADPPFGAAPKKIEKPGRYFHPLLATLITGAARLMLAITEKLAIDEGLDWAFCDTDSMAFAKPDRMSEAEFATKVQAVCQWFEGLNPYEEAGSILEMEKQNFTKDPNGEKTETPLYCFAVSAKRYALFNDNGGDITIRKASAHGLGHLRAPYEPQRESGYDEDQERESGVAVWQEDVWRAIIHSAKSGRPRHVPLNWHENLTSIAASQHSASTPDLLRGFRRYNQDKDYPLQVKPFNFMLWFHAKRIQDRMREASNSDARPWNPRERQPKPTSPFRRNVADVPDAAIFDRETGNPVPKSALRTYAEVLRSYHHSPETKFLNGGGHSIGALRRRHVLADQLIYIGKEADAFEEVEEFGEEEDHVTVYGNADDKRAEMIAIITTVPVVRLKSKAQVGHELIGRVISGGPTSNYRLILKLYNAALAIIEDDKRNAAHRAFLFDWAKVWTEDHSVQTMAHLAGYDASNLRKALKSGTFGKALAAKVAMVKDHLEAEGG